MLRSHGAIEQGSIIKLHDRIFRTPAHTITSTSLADQIPWYHNELGTKNMNAKTIDLRQIEDELPEVNEETYKAGEYSECVGLIKAYSNQYNNNQAVERLLILIIGSGPVKMC